MILIISCLPPIRLSELPMRRWSSSREDSTGTYENYLRHELRDWAEDILYDERTAAREIFEPSFLRTLMNRHLSGMEEATIGKIAPLITYEKMLRRYYD